MGCKDKDIPPNVQIFPRLFPFRPTLFPFQTPNAKINHYLCNNLTMYKLY